MSTPQTLVAATALATALSPVVGGAPGLREGEPFPDLVLPSMTDGRPMSLADFRGRKVILHVFASW